MKNVLICKFRWMVVTSQGKLETYRAPDISSDFATSAHFKLEEEFDTREEAVEAYSNLVNSDVSKTPRSMILVEEHHIDINWDE